MSAATAATFSLCNVNKSVLYAFRWHIQWRTEWVKKESTRMCINLNKILQAIALSQEDAIINLSK